MQSSRVALAEGIGALPARDNLDVLWRYPPR